MVESFWALDRLRSYRHGTAVPEEDDAMCAEGLVHAGLGDRLLAAFVGMQELLTIQLGLDLGLYQIMSDAGPVTASQVAVASGMDERYVREWLEQQAVAAVISVDDADADPHDRTYWLPPENATTLLSQAHLDYLAPLGALAVALAEAVPHVAEAFRTGSGVPRARYGERMHQAASRLNRPLFQNLLARRWLPAVPGLEDRLRARPALVADVGCGAGWSSIALAEAYPKVTVHGLDIDERSVHEARRHAEEAGVGDRAHFFVEDIATCRLGHDYDLVACFEALHDMPRPIEALRGMRGLLGEGGSVLIAEEHVQDSFVAPGDHRERSVYCWSVLHCLPIGRIERPSAATGAVLRPSALARQAGEAGFPDVTVLPIDDPVWRFYHLRK